MSKQKMITREWDEVVEGALRSRSRFEIEASPNFESRFWQKILEREKEPWFLKRLQGLGSLIPIPSYSQVFAILLIALVVGGTGGFISGVQAMTAPQPVQAQKSIEYLSGFRAFGGISSTTLAGSYLKVVEESSQSIS